MPTTDTEPALGDTGDMVRMEREVPGPGQESVWDYPRPPRLELSPRSVEIRVADRVLARSARAYRVLETSHPPGWYLPPADIDMSLLRPSARRGTVCEWKGAATYWDVVVDGMQPIVAPAWSYPRPTAEFEAIADHVAFYPSLVQCSVDGIPVRPQDGGFYGGWITPDVVGPFKGGTGTWGW